MRAAISAGIDGIAADCGGCMTCATCHVIVDPAWVDRLPAASRGEEAMLEMTAVPRQPTSRLSCQIVLDASLDGLRGGLTRNPDTETPGRYFGRRPGQQEEPTLRLLEMLAKLCAIAAGVLLTVVTLMTCVQPDRPQPGRLDDRRRLRAVGRRGRRGDRAVHAVVPAAARQHHRRLLHRERARERTIAGLDRFGALLLGLAMALLAWRTTLGGLNAWKSGSGTMLIGFPEWVVYVGMVPPLVLTAVIAAGAGGARLPAAGGRVRTAAMTPARDHRR